MNHLIKPTLIAALISTLIGCATCAKNPANVVAEGNYKGCNLNGYDLSNQDLSGSNFKGAHLNDVNLTNTNLEGSDLEGAAIKNSSLRGANLRSTDLNKANLSFSDLSGADLNEASGKVTITGVKLDGATWVNGRKCAVGSSGYCKRIGGVK